MSYELVEMLAEDKGDERDGKPEGGIAEDRRELLKNVLHGQSYALFEQLDALLALAAADDLADARNEAVRRGDGLAVVVEAQEFWRPLRYNSPDCPVEQRTVSGGAPDYPVCQRSNDYFVPTVVCRRH